MASQGMKGIVAALVAGSLLFGSTAAAASTVATVQQPSPWAILTAMSGGAPAAAMCGSAATSAAAQGPGGCVLPVVDASPVPARRPRLPTATASSRVQSAVSRPPCDRSRRRGLFLAPQQRSREQPRLTRRGHSHSDGKGRHLIMKSIAPRAIVGLAAALTLPTAASAQAWTSGVRSRRSTHPGDHQRRDRYGDAQPGRAGADRIARWKGRSRHLDCCQWSALPQRRRPRMLPVFGALPGRPAGHRHQLVQRDVNLARGFDQFSAAASGAARRARPLGSFPEKRAPKVSSERSCVRSRCSGLTAT